VLAWLGLLVGISEITPGRSLAPGVALAGGAAIEALLSMRWLSGWERTHGVRVLRARRLRLLGLSGDVYVVPAASRELT
jgi:hypothetical protein